MQACPTPSQPSVVWDTQVSSRGVKGCARPCYACSLPRSTQRPPLTRWHLPRQWTQRAAPASPPAGSYIFSQTLFGSRMGVDSRLMGGILTGGAGSNLNAPGWLAACHWHTPGCVWLHAACWHLMASGGRLFLDSWAAVGVKVSCYAYVSAVAELAVFMVPFNVMTYLPSFYFGGVIAWIGQDILKASIRALLVHSPACWPASSGLVAVCLAGCCRGPQECQSSLSQQSLVFSTLSSAGLAVHRRQARVGRGVLPAAGHLWAGHGLWAGGGHRRWHRAGRPALCLQVRGGVGWGWGLHGGVGSLWLDAHGPQHKDLLARWLLLPTAHRRPSSAPPVQLLQGHHDCLHSGAQPQRRR